MTYKSKYTGKNIEEILGKSAKHLESNTSKEDGSHGIKYTKDGKLKVKNEYEVWDTIINPYKVYTAVIDEEESDPDLAVSYADDAKDMEAKSEKWLATDIFKDIRPCLFKDGKVQCYLDPNDYTQQIKNKEPLFYSEDEIEVKLDGRCAYTEIIQAEDADVYDENGEKAIIKYYDSTTISPETEISERPIGEWCNQVAFPANTTEFISDNRIKGYGVQGGYNTKHDKDRNENITVYYKDKGYMEYKFNVPVAGEYYWTLKFNSQVSNLIRQQEFHINEQLLESMITVKNTEARLALTTADVILGQLVEEKDTKAIYRVIDINKLNSEEGYEEYEGAIQIITFPQKGKQWGNPTTYWEQEDSKYILQAMRERIYCQAGENIIRVYTPADYWSDTSGVTTIEIDYMALTYIETPDIYSGDDYESFGSAALENVDIIKSGGKIECKGQVISNAYQCLQYIPTEIKTCNGESDYISFNVPFTQPLSVYPILKICCNFYNKDLMEDSSKTDKRVRIEVNPHFTFNDGTVKKMWGATKYENRIYCDGRDSYIYIDLTSFTKNGSFSDVNISLPISSLDLKPWYNNGNPLLMQQEDYFNIHQIALYRDWDVAVNSPATCAPSGDVMIEIPKMGYRFNRVDNNVHVSITRDPEAVGFSYDAFLRGDRLNDYIYIGAYPGTTLTKPDQHGKNYIYGIQSEKKIRSLSRAYPSNNPYYYFSLDKLTSAKLLAENNNTDIVRGYGLLTYLPYTLICCLNLLYNKSINCSLITLEEQPTRTDLTGDFDKNGMYFCDKDKKCNFKFIGLEDLSGKTYRATLDGIKYAKNGPLLISIDNLTNENNWFSLENIIPKHGYKKGIQATNILGFLTNFEGGGTSSTYYCSYESHQNNVKDTIGQITKTNTGIMSFSITYCDNLSMCSNSRLMYSKEVAKQ